MNQNAFLAVDLGAGSGRVILGTLKQGKLSLSEVNRFSNDPIKDSEGDHWNIDQLLIEIKAGIRKAIADSDQPILSLGVDTWGVDYGLIDEEGKLLNKPFQYRDPRTDGMMEKVFESISKEQIYEETGIQFMSLNTLYQIAAEKQYRSDIFKKTKHILFIPDLLNYFLTGKIANEKSIASTSQMLNATSGEWSKKIFQALDIPSELFNRVSAPGTALGTLSKTVTEEVGTNQIQVILPGSHDTASAVAGVPAQGKNWAYLSSGTWSLMGVECEDPILSPKALELGFTNESGVCGTVRLLKNITGMWILQECKRVWAKEGLDMDYDTLVKFAEECEPFLSIIDVDDAIFSTPGDMPQKICDYCQSTKQQVPQSKREISRVIFDSLALKYLDVWDKLETLTGKKLDQLHIVGGGSQNRFLNQLIANALNVQVIAGPVEATAAGNILIQMLSLKLIDSIEQGRELVSKSFPTESFEPQNSKSWETPFEKYQKILKLREEMILAAS